MAKLRLITPINSDPRLPLFVFLPGMDGSGELLSTQVDDLATVFDLRCLQIPSDDFSNWETLCEQIIALIKGELALKSHQSCYLCGESFGGCLGIKVALDAPKLVNRLILVNPATCFNQQPLLGWGVPITSLMPDWFYQVSTLTLLPFLVAPGRVTPDNRDTLLNAMRAIPHQNASWRLSLLQQFWVSDTQLRKIEQPVLLIAGAEDRLLPSVTEAERLVKIFPNALRVILAESGHACLLEKEIKLKEIMVAQSFVSTNCSFIWALRRARSRNVPAKRWRWSSLVIWGRASQSNFPAVNVSVLPWPGPW